MRVQWNFPSRCVNENTCERKFRFRLRFRVSIVNTGRHLDVFMMNSGFITYIRVMSSFAPRFAIRARHARRCATCPDPCPKFTLHITSHWSPIPRRSGTQLPSMN